MAEKGAYITANLQDRPSLFELIAQESFASILQPALQRVIEYISVKNPERLGWLYSWYDEIFLGLNTILQYHYIRYYDASFSETFYGLYRKSVLSTNLSSLDKYISLSCLTLLPYLQKKLEEYAFKCKLQLIDGALENKTLTNRCKKYFVSTYGSFNFIWNCLRLVQYLKYMSGRSQYYSPLMFLISTTLQHTKETTNQFSFLNFWSRIWKKEFPDLSYRIFGQTLIRAMELAAFFIQFLQWWNAEYSHMNLTSLPAPSAPNSDTRSSHYRGVCPICLQSWVIPTVLPVSGYVFCYRCIIKHLRNSSYCPVTNYPASTEELVRLYDQ